MWQCGDPPCLLLPGAILSSLVCSPSSSACLGSPLVGGLSFLNLSVPTHLLSLYACSFPWAHLSLPASQVCFCVSLLSFLRVYSSLCLSLCVCALSYVLAPLFVPVGLCTAATLHVSLPSLLLFFLACSLCPLLPASSLLLVCHSASLTLHSHSPHLVFVAFIVPACP